MSRNICMHPRVDLRMRSEHLVAFLPAPTSSLLPDQALFISAIQFVFRNYVHVFCCLARQ
eukprot:8885619-Pyramimonas_sp.AAC.1